VNSPASQEKSRRTETPVRVTDATPRDFDFVRTAFSHGWYALPPFSSDTKASILSRILRLNNGRVVSCMLSAGKNTLHIAITANRRPSQSETKEIIAQVRSCLRLDEDFRSFHAEARKRREYAWMASAGAGRMLRAPTVFEDVVKMMCTTNCSWALTTIMVTNIVNAFGEEMSGVGRAFPTPETMAASTERFLRKEIKTGYRSPFVLEFAERVASGKLNPESWRNSPLTTDELFKAMLDVKGIGPYAAGNIMKLVGRYDYLGLDSWVRARYYALHRKGRTVKDATIERHYAPYGSWRGLIFWLEMTRDWHDDKFPSLLQG
jgi:3-methyladenine DNA glycosylase/8-oxoguanine DNA glycosylase